MADSMETMLTQGDAASFMAELKQRDKTLWEKIRDWFKNLAEKLRGVVDAYQGYAPDSPEGRLVAQMEDFIGVLQEAYSEALMDASENYRANEGNKKTTREGGVKYSINQGFYTAFDAWDGKQTNVTFTVGKTSDPLMSIGMKDQEIVLRSGTVLQKLKDHPEMTRDIFRDIPKLLEHPVIVQFSDAIDPKTNRPKYDSSITILGELYASVTENAKTVQKPVLVSLELLPTNQKKTAVLDFSVIKSAYAKNALQKYINDNSILYVDPNKKRTDSWLSLNRLQLPLGENRYGPIRRITYDGGKVKVQNPKNMTDMQKALLKAGAVDEFGNKLFSDRDPTAAATAQELEKQNAKLRQDVKDLRELLSLQGKLTKGTEFRRSSIEAAVKGLAQTAGATLDADGRAQLKGFYRYIASDENLAWEGVREEAGKIADFLQSNVKFKPQRSDYANDVLGYLRGQRVALSESQRAEVEKLYGYENFRRQLFGAGIYLSKDGISLDSLWNEAAGGDMFPEYTIRSKTVGLIGETD